MARCAWPGLGLLVLSLSAAALPDLARHGSHVRYRCEAVYLPARISWVRSVEIIYDRQQVRAVRIDDAPVHRFAVSGTTLRTSLDNERIAFDTASLNWQSDWRGLAQAQGPCQRSD